MKTLALLIPVALFAATSASAQTPIWRCSGNVYTNNQPEAQARGCKLVEGGNVTVVQGTRVNGAAKEASTSAIKSTSAPAAASGGQRIDSTEQRARDNEARTILESELKKAESRHADLLKEYNNGEPEKMGPEHRNYQKYLDRVAGLKAAIERNEKDIAGLKRELGRAGGNVSAIGGGTVRQ